jgi:hypothetical protein
MKLLLLISLLGLPYTNAVGENEGGAEWTLDFHDPRHIDSLYTWLEDGSENQEIRQIDRSILIICWMPDTSGGDVATYQISGIQGRHSEAHAKRFLDEFYALELSKENGKEPLNVIIVGTNWGAGIHLKEKLKGLSKKHSFSVFYAGGKPFRKVLLINEPESRLILIRKAHERATKSEQGAAEQPATAGESK